jgi:hypothetical protein
VIWLLGTGLGRWLAGVAAGLVLLASLLWAGRRQGRQAAERRALGHDLEARERADAGSAVYRGDGGARGRLRDGRF